MSAVHFDGYTAARAHLKDLLDAAARGRAATIRREQDTSAVVDSARLRRYLAATTPYRPQAVAENDGWSVFIPGAPIAADGNTLAEAVEDMLDALREYAEDWHDTLLDVPNHREYWSLAQLVSLSSDDELREWLTGSTQ